MCINKLIISILSIKDTVYSKKFTLFENIPLKNYIIYIKLMSINKTFLFIVIRKIKN